MTADVSLPIPGVAAEPFAGLALPAGATAVGWRSAVSVRLDVAHPALAARVGAELGVELPHAANTVAGHADGRHALWLGPDEWLVVDAPGQAPAIEAAVRAAALGSFAVAVDVSANRCAVELAGPTARELLSCGCPLDLHPRAFGPGRCAQTLLGRVGVLLHQVGPEPRYRLWVRPSFARYCAAWLTDAAIGLER
ncbi:MAG: sarcosine oxidase subunit gamma family protein [Chloroflexota bacterium]